MTKEEQIREEQIIEAGSYHLCGSRPPKTCGHNMHELTYITRNLVFEAGAKWADDHPKSEMVNKDEFIEKVKDWLKNNIDEDVFVKCGNVIKIMDAHDFSEYFCKVIKE